MKALVAGAGIGGLAAGVALRKTGHEVEIFERSNELREIGAGLMIWPNGVRAKNRGESRCRCRKTASRMSNRMSAETRV